MILEVDYPKCKHIYDFIQIPYRLLLNLIPWMSVAASISLETLRRTLELFLLWWFFNFISSSLLDAVDSGMTICLLFDIATCTVFPRGGASCRLSSRRSNLSSIAWELCCRTMLHMLLSNSFVCCIPRLSHNSWKLHMGSGCEADIGIEGLIKGIWVDPSIWEAWRRS